MRGFMVSYFATICGHKYICALLCIAISDLGEWPSFRPDQQWVQTGTAEFLQFGMFYIVRVQVI